MKARFIDAGIVLQEICPHGDWNISNNDYDTLIWSENNSVSKPTKEDFDNKLTELQNAEPMRLLREERNRKLAETDWKDLPSYPGTDQEEWRTYRQALRDLPSSSSPQLDEFGQLTNVTWPTKPE